MEISTWPLLTATAADKKSWYDVWAANHREGYPDEPLPPQRAAWFWQTATPQSQSIALWRACDDVGRLLGWASARRELRGSNQHRVATEVQVAPTARRRGVATALVRRVAQAARADGATVLGVSATDTPAAGAFLAGVGATRCLVDTRSLLHFDALDAAGIAAAAQRPAAAQAYSLVRWGNDLSDDELIELARIFAVMNTAPRGQLTINDEPPDPLARREWLQLVKAAGDDFVTFCARHEPSGELAGFTTVRVSTSSWPGHGFQEDTGVDPAHRGHGLGLWLKSAMLAYLLHNHPMLRRLETWNAADNEHMLGINRRLGYVPASVEIEWELSGPALEHLST